MEFSGHRSREGIKAYNNSNEDQKIQNTALLIPLDCSDLPYEEFNYFPGDGTNYINFEDNPEIYDDSNLMTAAEKLALDNDEGPEQYYEHLDSSNSTSTSIPIRSNFSKKSTFRSRIPRLSGQRPPLKSVTNQTAPYFIPTFHDIKQFNEPSESDNKQEIHYHFHYHF